MGPIYSIADLLDMLRRRMWLIAAVVIFGALASVFWALSVPHVYQSSEVIQIEQPIISDELARSTVESSAARRLQLIEQRLMARDNLLDLIQEYGLFADLPALRPTEKVDLLRQSISITGLAAAREGFGEDGAISVLTITTQMADPVKARDVAHALASKTRNLASAQRQEQTSETLSFFKQQEDKLVNEITALEGELTAFRNDNNLSIPGSLEFQRTELGSLNDAILSLDREIIATQLAMQNIDRSGKVRAATVQREEEALDRQMVSLTQQRDLLQQRRDNLSASIESTPEIERTLVEYDRQISQLRGQLDLVVTRRNEAQIAANLENNARGEKFTILEEAQVPDYPISTSRKLRVVAGTFAAGLMAIGLAFLLELRRPVLRTAAHMQRETGLLPVVSIPDTRQGKRTSNRQDGAANRLRLSVQSGKTALVKRLDPGQ